MRVIFPFISFRTPNNRHPKPGHDLASTPLLFLPMRGEGKWGERAAAVGTHRRAPVIGLLAICSLVSTLVLAGCTQNLGGTGSGWSPAVASEGVVYVGTRQGEVKALVDEGRKVANVKWTFSPGGKKGLQGVFHTPAVGEGLVYVSAIDGYLYAIDKNTGDIGWKSSQIQGKDPKPLVGSPSLDPNTNTVVVGSEDGNLYAYDAATGDPLPWSPFATRGRIWSTPVIRDGVIYFGSQDHNVYALSLKDGKELWRFPTGGAVVARPLLLDNTVVIGSFDKKLYGINARDGKPRWEFDQGKNWFWAGAVAKDNTIFAASMDGNVYALDQAGGLLWKHGMGSAIVSTPVVLSRWLVVAAKDGKLSVLDPGSRREISSPYDIRAEIKAPLFALEDSVFVGAQDGTVRRIDIRVRGALVNRDEVWCFHTKDIQCK